MSVPLKAAIAQLLAHRDTLAAALAQTEATLITLGVDLDDGEPEGCTHPGDQVVNESTFGTDAYRCRACGESFDHHPHHQKE